jgi:tetratricopeptide (TPR) repeat protein
MRHSIIITTLLFITSLPVSAAPPPEVTALGTEWAKHKYQTPKNEREAAFKQLAEQAAEVSRMYPGKAEPLIWEAIILASAAGEQGGLGALSLVKRAKELLEQAEQIDAHAMDGSIYTSLGSLYYQVPGWPVGFGDDEKAMAYLKKALLLNPNGIDPNYFYGDFLLSQKDFSGAIKAFDSALAAPPRPNQLIADNGRREEVKIALAKAKKQQQSESQQMEHYAHPFSGR